MPRATPPHHFCRPLSLQPLQPSLKDLPRNCLLFWLLKNTSLATFTCTSVPSPFVELPESYFGFICLYSLSLVHVWAPFLLSIFAKEPHFRQRKRHCNPSTSPQLSPALSLTTTHFSYPHTRLTYTLRTRNSGYRLGPGLCPLAPKINGNNYNIIGRSQSRAIVYAGPVAMTTKAVHPGQIGRLRARQLTYTRWLRLLAGLPSSFVCPWRGIYCWFLISLCIYCR